MVNLSDSSIWMRASMMVFGLGMIALGVEIFESTIKEGRIVTMYTMTFALPMLMMGYMLCISSYYGIGVIPLKQESRRRSHGILRR